MKYYAKITRQKDKTYLVEFPELEGCLTEGKTLEKAKANAKEALDGWLMSHCDRELSISKPKARRSSSFYAIDVDIQIAFAVSLRQLRKKKRLSQTDVADMLEISQQAYAKLESPGKANPSLKTIQKLAETLEVEFSFDLAA